MTPKLKLTCLALNCPCHTGGECMAKKRHNPENKECIQDIFAGPCDCAEYTLKEMRSGYPAIMADGTVLVPTLMSLPDDESKIGQISEKLDQSESMRSGYAKIESIESDWEAELKQDYDDGWFFGNDPRMTNKPVNFLRLRHYIRDLLHTKANPTLRCASCNNPFSSHQWMYGQDGIYWHTGCFQKDTTRVHAMVSSAYEEGQAKERDRWINQPANEHDQRIHHALLDELAERVRIKKRGVYVVAGEEVVDDRDGTETSFDKGFNRALDTVLGIIQEFKAKS